MFRSVPTRPDLVSMEHETLAMWRERRTFARLRAQLAGKPRWSFLDGPITANNPMGVHHAWGRTYKDLYQHFGITAEAVVAAALGKLQKN